MESNATNHSAREKWGEPITIQKEIGSGGGNDSRLYVRITASKKKKNNQKKTTHETKFLLKTCVEQVSPQSYWCNDVIFL